MGLEGKTRVLEIGYEGGAFELFADIEGGVPVRFFYETGGPTIFDEEGDPPDPVRGHGPFTWAEVLAKELEPNGWLRLYPLFLHPCMFDLVQACIAREPRTRDMWVEILSRG